MFGCAHVIVSIYTHMWIAIWENECVTRLESWDSHRYRDATSIRKCFRWRCYYIYNTYVDVCVYVYVFVHLSLHSVYFARSKYFFKYIFSLTFVAFIGICDLWHENMCDNKFQIISVFYKTIFRWLASLCHILAEPRSFFSSFSWYLFFQHHDNGHTQQDFVISEFRFTLVIRSDFFPFVSIYTFLVQ